jgi:glutathione synthase/RimK-type ligase-like ATP-grasp enzyme
MIVFVGDSEDKSLKRLLEEADKMGARTGSPKVVLCRDSQEMDEVKIKKMKEELRRLDDLGARIVDREVWLNYPLFQDKLFQERRLSEAGIEVLGNWKISGFPVLVKKRWGSRAKGIRVIKGVGELKRWLSEGIDLDKYLIQEYRKLKGDYRVLMLGGRSLGVVKREVRLKGDGRLGVKVAEREINADERVLDLAKRAVESLGVEIGGVDVLEDEKGNFWVSEINLAPQFIGFERVTGINVAKKIVEYLV